MPEVVDCVEDIDLKEKMSIIQSEADEVNPELDSAQTLFDKNPVLLAMRRVRAKRHLPNVPPEYEGLTDFVTHKEMELTVKEVGKLYGIDLTDFYGFYQELEPINKYLKSKFTLVFTLL